MLPKRDLMNIRLREQDVQLIIQSFKECFGEHDHLWIFGSRVHMDKRGGDIDLYIEALDFDWKILYGQRQRFWIVLQERLGEQKIDLVLKDPKQDLEIYKVARAEGIQLV